MSDNSQQKSRKSFDAKDWSRTMSSIAEQSQKIVADYLATQNKGMNGIGMGDPANVGKAFFDMTRKMMTDPAKLWKAQMDWWQDYMTLVNNTTKRWLVGTPSSPVIEASAGDRRFKDDAWQQNTIFDFIKQSYLLTARTIQGTIKEVDGLDEQTARKVDFYTRQFVDAMAPSNFVMTNPEVLRATVDSGGENLVKGLKNMLEDLERGKGQLRIRMTDEKAFKVGEDIAVTPGKVIYQNDLIQLIQYTPSTDKVFKTPLLIIPPWINKFYILDLRAKNSYVKWLVDQGHTVYMISWVNPGKELADKGFDAYMQEGPLAAIDAIRPRVGSAAFWDGAWLPGARMVEMKTGHDPMISAPEALVGILTGGI
jgi:polyhydroxyalkanoate synthase